MFWNFTKMILRIITRNEHPNNTWISHYNYLFPSRFPIFLKHPKLLLTVANLFHIIYDQGVMQPFHACDKKCKSESVLFKNGKKYPFCIILYIFPWFPCSALFCLFLKKLHTCLYVIEYAMIELEKLLLKTR